MREYRVPSGEEIARIKSNDREAIDGFFMSNYELIEEVARGWLLRKTGRFDRSAVEELRDEAYLWLPNCDLDDKAHFVVSLRDCFFCFHKGGKEYFYSHRRFLPDRVISLDASVKVTTRNGESVEGESLGARLRYRPQRSGVYEVQYRYILQLAKELLAPNALKAFRYRITTDLTFEEIGRELGKTKGCVNGQDREARFKFILNYKYVLAFLAQHGSTSAEYYIRNGIVPEKYDEAVAFFGRRLERSRENCRRYRARKQKEGQKPEK